MGRAVPRPRRRAGGRRGARARAPRRRAERPRARRRRAPPRRPERRQARRLGVARQRPPSIVALDPAQRRGRAARHARERPPAAAPQRPLRRARRRDLVHRPRRLRPRRRRARLDLPPHRRADRDRPRAGQRLSERDRLRPRRAAAVGRDPQPPAAGAGGDAVVADLGPAGTGDGFAVAADGTVVVASVFSGGAARRRARPRRGAGGRAAQLGGGPDPLQLRLRRQHAVGDRRDDRVGPQRRLRRPPVAAGDQPRRRSAR